VPEAVRRAGARPVFYRVGHDLTVSAAEFEAAFTPETRAAIVAHYFGRVLPGIEALAAICRHKRVAMIEDCALALGATRNERPAGTFGDLAIFSFTKSDWCYGGGMASSPRAELVERMRAVRAASFGVHRSLALRYGLLRRVDLAANRPRFANAAEHAGRWIERLTGPLAEPATGNFYDAGRFDAALPGFAARRVRRILKELPMVTKRRREVLRQLTAALGSALLQRETEDAGDTGSFLLLRCPAGAAESWVEQAAHYGVTLRRAWPVFQPPAFEQIERDSLWFAQHLLLLELHPALTEGEIAGTQRTLLRVATRTGAY
jgi:dTDP-4-amino-4,6-dideoxygalactose transaminase